MIKQVSLSLALFLGFFSSAQSIEELYEQHDFNAIIEAVDTIVSSPIEDVHLFARAAHAVHNDSIGVYILKQVVSTQRANATTRFELGKGYYHLGKLKKAAEWFRAARLANPDFFVAYLAEADAYEKRLQLDSAVSIYHQTVRHFDDKGIALVKTCVLPTEEGYIDSAIQCWEKNMDLFERPQERELARQELVTLYWQFAGDTLAAEDLLLDLIEMQPNQAKYRLQAIQLYSEMDDWLAVKYQISILRNWMEEGSLSEYYTRRNAIPLLSIKSENFNVQVFEIIKNRPNSEEFSAKWSAYFTTPTHGRLIGYVRYYENDGDPRLMTNINGLTVPRLDEALSIEEFVTQIKQLESNLY